MNSVRTLFVTVAGIWSAGCTQVHQLGQIDAGADDATSSMFSEDSGDSDDASSTSSDDGTDTSSETSDDGEGSEETDGEESGETGSPMPDACDVVDFGGNAGVTIDIVLMNQWDAGACHEFHVTNETPDDLIWTRDLRFGGTLDNYWNAEAEQINPTDWRFEGQASAGNIVVLSGQTVTFGACMVCTPS